MRSARLLIAAMLVAGLAAPALAIEHAFLGWSRDGTYYAIDDEGDLLLCPSQPDATPTWDASLGKGDQGCILAPAATRDRLALVKQDQAPKGYKGKIGKGKSSAIVVVTHGKRTLRKELDADSDDVAGHMVAIVAWRPDGGALAVRWVLHHGVDLGDTEVTVVDLAPLADPAPAPASAPVVIARLNANDLRLHALPAVSADGSRLAVDRSVLDDGGLDAVVAILDHHGKEIARYAIGPHLSLEQYLGKRARLHGAAIAKVNHVLKAGRFSTRTWVEAQVAVKPGTTASGPTKATIAIGDATLDATWTASSGALDLKLLVAGQVVSEATQEGDSIYELYAARLPDGSLLVQLGRGAGLEPGYVVLSASPTSATAPASAP